MEYSLIDGRVLLSLVNELRSCCFPRKEVLSQLDLSQVALAEGLWEPSCIMGISSAEMAEWPCSMDLLQRLRSRCPKARWNLGKVGESSSHLKRKIQTSLHELIFTMKLKHNTRQKLKVISYILKWKIGLEAL
jgi:hypothetical protein